MNKSKYDNKEEIHELLSKFKNGEIDADTLADRIIVKPQLPSKPYFRKTKSRAIALYGIKKDPLVMYKHHWLRLSKVFSGGKECIFNKFFFYTEDDEPQKQLLEKTEKESSSQ